MINEVAYEQVLSIRHLAMYPNHDKEIVVLPQDGQGLHIGYFVEGKPVSVFSLFLNDRELQFRKFATLPEHQGYGYGTKLLEWLLDYAKDIKFKRVWCNSRKDKTKLYEKFGFTKTSETFEKNGFEYIVMEKNFDV